MCVRLDKSSLTKVLYLFSFARCTLTFINTNLLNTNFVLWFSFIANYLIFISLYVRFIIS